MADLHQFREHFILLCEAGFIAVNQADEDAAVKLFRASLLLNPDQTLSKVGMGYLHMMKLELNQACKQFNEVLEKEPQNEMARAFLGICYALTASDLHKGEKILEESASRAHDPMVKGLAHTALDFVNKFIKKAPSPVEVRKPGAHKSKKKRYK